MADALVASVNVFEGFWTDWSKGRPWGLTLTLSPTKSTILTNSLTLFVTIAGIQLWAIIRYTLHQHRAPAQFDMGTPHHRMQQRILRNSSSSLATARLMLSIAWNSRRSTGKRPYRAYLIGLFAILYELLFMAASIFSNKAISAGSTNGASTVVSTSKSCGLWNQTYFNIATDPFFEDKESLELLTQFNAKLAQSVQLSFEYAQDCYLHTSTSKHMSATCNTLKTPRIRWESLNKPRETSCPFELSICHDQSDVLVLDTGEIDSHRHLGINARPEDRLTYQRITTCAVLNNTGYITGWDGAVTNSTSRKPPPNATYAYYGPSIYKETDYTYSYSNFASFYDNFSTQVTTPYQLDVEMAVGVTDPQYTNSDFQPIGELEQEKADLTLLFLSFIGKYLGEIKDPWFSAHEEQQFPGPISFMRTRFARDTAISALGCTEQHRFCTSNGACTAFLGFDQVQNNQTFNAILKPHQNATFDRILRAVADSSLNHVVQNLALTTDPLLASNSTEAGKSGAVISLALPDDQWQLELNYWHSIAMAQLQRTIAQWATGQIAPEPQYVKYLLPPQEEQDIWFCKNLIVLSMVYQSFSVVAIILIIVFGALVIIASLNVERLAALIRRCFRKSAPALNWARDHMLEPQHNTKEESQIPQHLPQDNEERPLSRQTQIRERVDLTPQSGHQRVSSQVLPFEDPVASSVNAWMASMEASRHPISPARPARESWMTISLDSLHSATPEIPNNLLNYKQEAGSPKSAHMSNPYPRTSTLDGLRLHNLHWGQDDLV